MKIACLYSLCWYRCYDDEDDNDDDDDDDIDNDDDDDDDNDDDGDDDDDDDGGGGGGGGGCGMEEFDSGVVDDMGTRPRAIQLLESRLCKCLLPSMITLVSLYPRPYRCSMYTNPWQVTSDITP